LEKDPSISMATSKGRRTLDSLDGFSTSIGPDNNIKGDIAGSGHSIILGKFEGNGKLDGTLVVGEGGNWTGNITADNVVIAGEVNGDVVAIKKIDVVSTARISGSLTSPFIAIAEGAVHEGEIHMGEVKRYTDKREAE
jgi:cytoskeletal protein CcmA (bactofilin family)